jgi:hypothetical protein
MTVVEGYVKSDVVDEDTSHTPEEGTHSPSGQTGLLSSSTRII